MRLLNQSFNMKKSILILFVITWSIILSSCAVQEKQPKILITHVLAVTEQGDTLRLPINMIRPNVVYKIINYGNNYRPYYNDWNYRPYHNNNQNIYVRPNNNSNNNNNTNPSKPTKPNNKFESKDISRLEVNEGRLKKNN